VAQGSDGQLPGRLDPRQLECPTGAYRHLPSEFLPVALAEGSSSLTTADSRARRGCSKDQPRSPQSSVHYSSRSLVGLHLLEGFPDFPFGDVERLYLIHGLLLLPVGVSWPVVSAEQRSPFGPAPLQSLHP
jgi:hypothetical protein